MHLNPAVFSKVNSRWLEKFLKSDGKFCSVAIVSNYFVWISEFIGSGLKSISEVKFGVALFLSLPGVQMNHRNIKVSYLHSLLSDLNNISSWCMYSMHTELHILHWHTLQMMSLKRTILIHSVHNWMKSRSSRDENPQPKKLTTIYMCSRIFYASCSLTLIE